MTHPAAAFAEIFAVADGVEGWLTRDQARVLYDEARRVAPGTVVEIGSHLGRSTLVLAGSGAAVIAVDPFGADWKYGGPDTQARFRANLARSGLAERVEVRVATSQEVLATFRGPVRMVYIDGKHDHLSCVRDLNWARLLAPGDRVLVHDAFSSIGVTTALLRCLLTTRRLTYLDRTGSLARLEVRRPRARDRVRPLVALGWFARNVVVKVLLRLRLRRIAAVLGHAGSADPY